MTPSSFSRTLPAVLLVVGALMAAVPQRATSQPAPVAGNFHNDPDFYVGLWVTDGGQVRHELLPGGRYEEARGDQPSAYRGSYRLTGDHIDYRDDTGFTADGEFRSGVLHHAGMVLRRAVKK
jgi:Agrobacterium tumefaciens protein Atu4866